MKLATFTTLAMLLSIGYAFASGGAPVPAQPQGDPPSGRPGLDDAKCQSVWSMTERQGDVLLEDKAAPFIVKFSMVDTNDDGKISQDEFKAGCKNGWVQEPTQSGGGQTPQNPTKP